MIFDSAVSLSPLPKNLLFNVQHNKNKRDSPMNKSTLLTLLFVTLNMNIAHAAMDHSAHGGSKGSGGESMTCEKPQLSKFSPVNLALVPPSSEFSFRVLNIQHPEQISVTVKNIPVKVSADFKDPFYTVTAKLPDSLRNTVARINIKIDAKNAHCEAENGWLVKISE